MLKKIKFILVMFMFLLIIPFNTSAEEVYIKLSTTALIATSQNVTTNCDDSFFITYILNGGVNSLKNPTSYKKSSISIVLSNPTKTGYVFKGWYTSKKYKTKVTSIKKGSVGNKTLYAKWEPITYTIKFNGNGSTSGKMSSLTKRKYGKNYVLKANSYKKNGYTFIGWNTKKDGTGISIKNKETVKNLTTKNKSTVVLYAQWKKNIYNITYILNGGKNVPNPENYSYTTKSIVLKNSSKTGYIFKGWYTSKKYKTKVTSIKKGSVGNKTLYAKWEPITYTIKFNGNGASSGKMSSLTKRKYGKNYVLKANSYKKKGYTFIGWNTKKDGTGISIKNKETVKNLTTKNKSTVVLYAQWKKNGVSSNNCHTTLSGSKSCISNDLKWDSLKGIWYLKGTDDVMIIFSEDSSNYHYEGIRFEFHPSKVDYNGGGGGGLPKNSGYSAVSLALYVNITEVTSSSITIDNKYVFYREKNYPNHIESDLEKSFNNLQGIWYLEGYDDNVYIKLTSGVRNNEKVLFFEEYNFCSLYGTIYPTQCSKVTYFSYYSLNSMYNGISSYGLEYRSGYLYNTSGDKEMKFSKIPTSTPVEFLELNVNNLELFVNDTETLFAKISPNNASNKNIVWSSSDASIASVDSYGNVRAHSAGTAVITAITEDGEKKASCLVLVNNIRVKGVKLNKDSLNLTRGNSFNLIATVDPINATNKNVVWSSSDTSIATVDKYGNVFAVSKGQAVISVSTLDGEYTDVCKVNVSNPILSASASIGFSIRVSANGIYSGIKVNVTPSGGSGKYSYYNIKLFTYDNKLIGESNNTSNNELYVSGYDNGTYYAEFEVIDSNGESFKGKTALTTVSI